MSLLPCAAHTVATVMAIVIALNAILLPDEFIHYRMVTGLCVDTKLTQDC